MIAELIKTADIAFDNFKNNKKAITNSEVSEMGIESAKALGLQRQETHYKVLSRCQKLESFGYKKITLDEISVSLFSKKLQVLGTKHNFYINERYRSTDLGLRSGSINIRLAHYLPISAIPTSPSDSYTGIYNGYGDKVAFTGTPDGFFGLRKTYGFLSSPNYLNQPIPAELLARMQTLAKSKLIDCFYAAGPDEAFSFEEDRVVRVIDPIIVAVIDEGTGISSPFNKNTYMYFVGKYN